MKKRILSITVCLCLMLSMFSTVYAGSNKDIKDLKTFKQELLTLPSNTSETLDSEASQLVNETDSVVIEQFLDEKLALAQKKMSSNNLNLKLNGISKDYIDLGDNCYIKVTVKDIADGSLLSNTPGAETLWKDYGARQFTASYEIFLGVFDYTLNLVNHYTLGATGITVRYGEAWVDYGGAAQGSAGNVNTTKSSAAVGETVSMNCIFTLAQTTVPQYSKEFKMYNKVKCSAIDTAEQQVKVVQSWNGTWL